MSVEAKKARAPRTDTVWLHPYADIQIIGIDTSHKSIAEHPLWDIRIHDPLKIEDIDNVRKHGVLANCLVNRDGKIYRLVDGRGRVRRARVVCDEQIVEGVSFEDQIRVPCTLVRGDDVTLMMLSRVANSGRTIDSDYRNGEYAQALLKYGKSHDDIARVFGFSLSKLRNCLDLLNLGPEAVAAMESGDLTPTAAVQVAQLPRAEQTVELAEQAADLAKGIKPTVERITSRVRDKLGKTPSKTPKTRVAKATEILTAFADSFDRKALDKATRAELVEALDKAVATLDKVSRVITDSTLAKLADTSD